MKLAGNAKSYISAIFLDGEEDVAARLIGQQGMPAFIRWNSVDGRRGDERIQQIVECIPLSLGGKDVFNVVERIAKPIPVELSALRVNHPQSLGQILQFCSQVSGVHSITCVGTTATSGAPA